MRFLLLTLVTAACGFSALAEDDYFPLHIGDESTMAATLISKDGQVFEGIVRRSIETSVNRDGESLSRERLTLTAIIFIELEPMVIKRTIGRRQISGL